VRTCRGHESYISYVVVSPDNSLVASACTSGMIRIWRLSDGRCVFAEKHGEGDITWLQVCLGLCLGLQGDNHLYWCTCGVFVLCRVIH